MEELLRTKTDNVKEDCGNFILGPRQILIMSIAYCC